MAPPSVESIVQDRGEKYDHPKRNFDKIAILWGAYLRATHFNNTITITPEDVPAMMILLKIAREIYAHDPDNTLDIAGYAKTIDMLYDE